MSPTHLVPKPKPSPQQRITVVLSREEWEALYLGAMKAAVPLEAESIDLHNARAEALATIRRKLQETR